MKRIVNSSIIALVFIGYVSVAYGAWLQNGQPVQDVLFAKGDGSFGAMLILTDKPGELFEAWNQVADVVNVSMVSEIKKSKPVTALIVFSNSASNDKGNSNVTVRFTVISPTGKVIKKTGDLEVWVNRPAPAKRMLELSVDFIKIGIEDNNPLGLYTVKALVRDKISGKKIELERQLKAIAD